MAAGFTRINFPLADGTALAPARSLKEMEKILSQFASNWKASLGALLPSKNIVVSLMAVDAIPYAQFISRKGEEAADFQIFEIEALENLCVWGWDMRLVPMVVDGMFGGHGRWPQRIQTDRPLTPIEQRIRLRLWESLENAYETPWQTVLPQRLRALREESWAKNLRLVHANSAVYAADFTVQISHMSFQLSFCLPVSTQLQALWSDEVEPGHEAVWGKELRQQLRQAPLEATAVIARRQLTVSDLLQLTVGQVLPIDLEPMVDVQIEGVSVLTGRSGVKNQQYAVKVERVLDDLSRWADHQPPSTDSFASDGVSPATQGFVPGPLKSVAEALKEFDQHVAGSDDAKA